MNRYVSYLAVFMILIGLGCNTKEEKQAPVSAAPNPASSTPPSTTSANLKPPYPIEDSSAVQVLEGDIQMYVLEEGSGAIPTPNSNVMIHYHGMLTNGNVFDSSFDKGAPADFKLTQLIRGWQIGLTKVRTGSKIKLIVPPEYGYGAQARPNIPANSTLVFDIELITTY